MFWWRKEAPQLMLYFMAAHTRCGAAALVGEQNLQMHAIRWGVFTLDRGSGTWEFIPRKEQSVLYGCDGTRLASTTDHRSITWLEIGKQ